MADHLPCYNLSVSPHNEKKIVSKFFSNIKDTLTRDDDCLSNERYQNKIVVVESLVNVTPRSIKEYNNEDSQLQENSRCDSSSSKDINNVHLSQLCLNEKKKIQIEPLFNISPRLMPESPHHVIEEEFQSNPWAMLIATIFLTKTSARVARPLMNGFFNEFPSPYHLLKTKPVDLEIYFVNLGLRKRGHMIWKMSYQFVSAKWRRASDLCGIGKYGEDAYRLFCLGHTDVEPNDRFLKLYMDWLRETTDFLEDCGTEDCAHSIVLEDPVVLYYTSTLR